MYPPLSAQISIASFTSVSSSTLRLSSISFAAQCACRMQLSGQICEKDIGVLYDRLRISGPAFCDLPDETRSETEKYDRMVR